MVDYCRICNYDAAIEVGSCISGIAATASVMLILLSHYGYIPGIFLHIGCGVFLVCYSVLLWFVYKSYSSIVRRCLRRSVEGRIESDNPVQNMELATQLTARQQEFEPSSVAVQTDESLSSACSSESTPLLLKTRLESSVNKSLWRMRELKGHIEGYVNSVLTDNKTAEISEESLRKLSIARSSEESSSVQEATRCRQSDMNDLQLIARVKDGLDEIIKHQESEIAETVRLSEVVKIPSTSGQQQLLKVDDLRLQMEIHANTPTSTALIDGQSVIEPVIFIPTSEENLREEKLDEAPSLIDKRRLSEPTVSIDISS